MDTNLILLWMVVASTLAMAVQVLRLGKLKNRVGGFIHMFAVLAVAAVLYLVAPDQAGWWSGLAWLALILLPGLSQRWLGRLVRRGEYQNAARLASIVRWLQPFSGNWSQALIFHALHLLQRGELVQAEEIITAYRSRQSAWGDFAWALLLQNSRRYAELLTWLKTDIGIERLPQKPDMIRPYLVALAETGATDTMVAEYFRFKSALRHPAFAPYLIMLRLHLFAYTKRLASVERILAEPLADVPADIKLYWRATAMPWASTEAQAAFTQLQHSEIFAVRAGAANRLAQAVTEKPLQLATELAQKLAAEAEEMAEGMQIKADSKAFSGKRTPWVSWLLIAAIFIVFIIFEWLPGGETNVKHLYKIGAMINNQYLDGEWWRVFTSLFLHLGWLHLILNAYALLLLGPFVERKLRAWRFLLLYLCSGALAMWLSAFTSEPRLLVGASGSIMGLLGASGAIMLRQYRQKQSPASRRFLIQVLLILALQTAFDIAIPHVSMTAHLCGFAAGFIFSLLVWRAPSPQQ